MNICHSYFYADALRGFHVKLPAEDQEDLGYSLCGKLTKWMYETCDAPPIWQRNCSETI